jgi:hypothetical protein
VLKNTGADVVYCVGSQALNLVASEMPDLLVLCHSIAPEEAESIADKVHACCPKIRVLLVVLHSTAEKQYGDARFDSTSLPEPKRLIKRATELLQGLPNHHQGEFVNVRQPRMAGL